MRRGGVGSWTGTETLDDVDVIWYTSKPFLDVIFHTVISTCFDK